MLMNRSDVDLSIIIVSYNAKNLLEICLKSIFEKIESITFEVFVVDNNSHDGSPDLVSMSFKEANLIANDQNLFFTHYSVQPSA